MQLLHLEMSIIFCMLNLILFHKELHVLADHFVLERLGFCSVQPALAHTDLHY